MKQKTTVLIALLISFSISTSISYAQNVFDFGFQRDHSVPVFDSANQLLKNPWVGGFNSVHFNAIDLNFDGIKDLVVFDTQTDKLYTFINNGTPGQVDYVYAPEYELAFPKIWSWIRLIDFNGDGKEDIFTYGFAGIKVYLNTSTPTTGISFSLYTPVLNAYQGGNYTNILVTTVDYPAIADVDGDGDLDVLVFYGLGALVQYYENKSMDNTGTLDTLWMELSHRCWGWFAEDDDKNNITLHIDSIDPNLKNYCQFNMKSQASKTLPGKSSPKHVGSSMLMLDLNDNGVMDMLLGDTDYPTLFALYNIGTPDSARIGYVDTLFPSYDIPVDVYHLPTADYLDVNNDGVKDLLVGALGPEWEVPRTDNIRSAWWYKNTGTNTNPVFSLQTTDFLTDQMIHVGANSHPVLFDYNGNGLLDLFIGNFGVRDSSWMDPWLTLYSIYKSSITLYENVGTPTQPAFKFITDDFANVSSLNLVGAYPTFGDLNGNGKPDMLLADTTGRLHLFENVAPAGQPMQLSYVSSNYQNIDVGRDGTPQLFDLDDDGLLDLIMGYRNQIYVDTNGMIIRRLTSLKWFKNTGTATNPVFTLQTDTLGGVNVNDSYYHYTDGYSSPCFFRDTTGKISLFVGSGTGLIFYYRDISNNLNGMFGKDSNMVHMTDWDTHYSVLHFENHHNNLQTIDAKRRSVVTVGDLYGNGYPDMIVGNFAGGLNFFKGTPPLGIGIATPEKPFKGDVQMFPNPASERVFIVIKEADRTIRTTTTVYTITGQLVMQVHNRGEDFFPIDIYNLKNGLYIVKVDVQSERHGTTASFNRKLVVKR